MKIKETIISAKYIKKQHCYELMLDIMTLLKSNVKSLMPFLILFSGTKYTGGYVISIVLFLLARFQIEREAGTFVHWTTIAIVVILTSRYAANKGSAHVYTKQGYPQRRIYFLLQTIDPFGHRICVVSVAV